VITASFEYARATSIEDAIAKLRAAGGEGKLIAGGHSLIPAMKFRFSEPKVLIDISRIAELCGVRQQGDAIEIGAATVHHDVATSPVVRKLCPMLAEAVEEIGDPQVRNRGTLGGSLAHADPAADYPAVMLALDADIRVQGSGGARVVKASDFFRGLFTVDLRPDEIIVGIRFTPVKSAGYAKLHQRASHYAIVGVAAALQANSGTIQMARVAVTGASSHGMRLPEVERALVGKPASIASIDEASQRAGAALEDINSDIHASEEYRRAMVPVFTRRALAQALARAT
jgi:carbon-monoxide dehydrogenase medium subunit